MYIAYTTLAKLQILLCYRIAVLTTVFVLEHVSRL